MRRRLLRALALAAALFPAAVPVMASHTSDHVTEDLWAVVAQAEQDMDEVVAAFQQELAGLVAEDEVDSAEAAADDAIQTLWSDAKKAISDLVRLFPSVLGPAGGAASQQIQAARSASQDAIAELSESWLPPEPLITTTTVPGTATTPPSNPGHGAVGPPPDVGIGSGGPPPETANGPPENAAPGRSDTLDPDLPLESDPVTPPSSIPATQEASIDPDLEAPTSLMEPLSLAQTPGQPLTLGQAAVQGITGFKPAGATERMAAVLDTVLPPAVVDLVLSPLLILEILARTTWEGGVAIVGPLSLLAMCAIAILIHDRRSKGQRLAG